MGMEIFKVPANAVDSISAHGEPSAEPQGGYLYIHLSMVLYFRDITLGGLIRLQDGVEIILNPEWFGHFRRHVEHVAHMNPD